MIETIDIICYTVIAVCSILGVKNQVTFKMHNKIGNAIFRYKMHCLDNDDIEGHCKVDFDDAESYYSTLFRIWDWGYKYILPADKFELVKPFIE
jgi:hypothetical protein